MPSTVSSGIKCRAYPDASLQTTLAQWMGCQRVIYNAKVSEDRLFASQWRLSLRTDPDQGLTPPIDQKYAQFKDKELTPWLFDVPSQVLRNGAFRWMEAKQRQLKGLASAPVFRHKTNFNSVMLTSEVFRLVAATDPRTGNPIHALELGTVAHPVGTLLFTPTQPYQPPKMIVIRRTGANRWFVSFGFEQDQAPILRTPEELAYELNLLADDELAKVVQGFDRNVKDNCLASSTGAMFDFLPQEKERLARQAKHRGRYQKKLARQVKGSKNQNKTKRKLARSFAYATHVRANFAHQTSHALVTDKATQVLAMEDLKIKNMVRRPKVKKDPKTGKWAKNDARAKAGLNQAILRSAWGRLKTCLSYKAARLNKLFLVVPPQYSSQECSQCGHTHSGNREGSRFACQRCGFMCQADVNAAQVVKKRAIALLRCGALPKAKVPKRTKFTKPTPTGADSPSVPVEPSVNRTSSAWLETPTLLASKQESLRVS